jgi:hypothetical protein
MGVLRTIHGNVASERRTPRPSSGSAGARAGACSTAGCCVSATTDCLPAASRCGLSDASGGVLLVSALSRVHPAGVRSVRRVRCSSDQRSWPDRFRRHSSRLRLRLRARVLRPSRACCPRRRLLPPSIENQASKIRCQVPETEFCFMAGRGGALGNDSAGIPRRAIPVLPGRSPLHGLALSLVGARQHRSGCSG